MYSLPWNCLSAEAKTLETFFRYTQLWIFLVTNMKDAHLINFKHAKVKGIADLCRSLGGMERDKWGEDGWGKRPRLLFCDHGRGWEWGQMCCCLLQIKQHRRTKKVSCFCPRHPDGEKNVLRVLPVVLSNVLRRSWLHCTRCEVLLRLSSCCFRVFIALDACGEFDP